MECLFNLVIALVLDGRRSGYSLPDGSLNRVDGRVAIHHVRWTHPVQILIAGIRVLMVGEVRDNV